jgi:nucleoside phosphorylase
VHKNLTFYDMAAPALDAFQIGIVCPLPIERAATQEVLDIEYDDRKERYSNDTNTYSLGKIGSHNVVIAGFPAGFTGLVAAATVASNLTKTFTSVKVLLCVGIGGGVWTESSDVRLGDVVVSEPAGGYGGIEQYSFGKALEGGKFERTSIQRPPPKEILMAVGKLKSNFIREKTDIATTITRFQQKRAFRYLGADNDRLFKTGSTHNAKSSDCAECDLSQLIGRKPRDPPIVDGLPVPLIHYGLIASADQLIKDSTLRDSLSMSYGGHIRCFEMEAAGLMNNYPCLVIRGISDYCDSHKRTDKGWHGCAAAMAAAYARELVKILPLNALAKEPTLAEVASKAG